jgi:hypothetical protein
MNSLITNISNNIDLLTMCKKQVMGKYANHKHMEYKGFDNAVFTDLLATINNANISGLKTIIFINIDNKCEINTGVLVVLKRLLCENVGIIFLLHSDVSELETNYFPLHLNSLFKQSENVFSIDINGKYKRLR